MTEWMLLPIEPTDGMIEASGLDAVAAFALWEKMARAAAPDLQRHLMTRAEARSSMKRLFEIGYAAGQAGDALEVTEEAQSIINVLMGDD